MGLKSLQKVVAMMSPLSGMGTEEHALMDFAKILRDFTRSCKVSGMPLCDVAESLYDFAWHQTHAGELEVIEVAYGDTVNSSARSMRLTFSNSRHPESEWFQRWVIEVPVPESFKKDVTHFSWSEVTISSNQNHHHKLSPQSFISDEASNVKTCEALSKDFANLSKFNNDLRKGYKNLHQGHIGHGKQVNVNCYFGENSVFTRYFQQIEMASGFQRAYPPVPLNDESRLCITHLVTGEDFKALTMFTDPDVAKLVDKELVPHVVLAALTTEIQSDVQELVALEALKWAKTHLKVGDNAVAESFPLNHNARFSELSAVFTAKSLVSTYLEGADSEAVEDYIDIVETVTDRKVSFSDEMSSLLQSHLLAGGKSAVKGRRQVSL